MVVKPIIAQEQANLNQITRQMVAATIMQAFQGLTVGVYREGDELLPIILRAPDSQRLDVASIRNVQIWSPAAQRMIPLRQVVSGFETVFEDDIIYRINRQRAIVVLSDPRVGEGPPLLNDLRPQIEAIELPPGYRLEWWGEFRNSAKAKAAAMKNPMRRFTCGGGVVLSPRMRPSGAEPCGVQSSPGIPRRAARGHRSGVPRTPRPSRREREPP